jgi:hypothetical protein
MRWILMPARHIKQHRAQVLPAVNGTWLSRNCLARAQGHLITGDAARLDELPSQVAGYVDVSPTETPRIIAERS